MYLQTILGANGAIGTSLARALANYTDQIRLVSRNPVKVNAGDELFQADITLPGVIEKAIGGSDVVYLTIGLEYRLSVWQEKWPAIVSNTIDACIKNHSRLVFFDNVYMYDQNEIPHMTESSVMNPPSLKGRIRMKLAETIMDNAKAGRLMALIARSADFYGPEVRTSIITQMVYDRLRKGMSPYWFIDPDRKHSLTYTTDAAIATALLGNTEDAYNQVWHLPTDASPLTGRELISLFASEMHKHARVSVIKPWMLRMMGLFSPLLRELKEMMYQYDRDYVFDSSKFNDKFSYVPITYQDGVRSIINYN